MKHKFVTIFVLLCLACGVSASEYMLLELKNGEQYSFLLADRPVITYENESLVINGNSTTSYSIEGVKEYRFRKCAAVQELSASTLQIVSVDDETIEVRNAKTLDLVSLLSVSGVQVYSAKADSEGRTEVKLPAGRGVYILSVGNTSFKVIRK